MSSVSGVYSTYIAYSFSVDEDVPGHESSNTVEDQSQVEEVEPVSGRAVLHHQTRGHRVARPGLVASLALQVGRVAA